MTTPVTPGAGTATAATAATPVVVAVPKSMAWLFATTVGCVLAYYFIGFEQGTSALFAGETVHEFVHDARHFIGFPCH